MSDIWNPISNYKPSMKQVILSNTNQRWIRFGFKYPGLNRWYYSTTTECLSWGSLDEEPTHWMPMIKGPWEKDL